MQPDVVWLQSSCQEPSDPKIVKLQHSNKSSLQLQQSAGIKAFQQSSVLTSRNMLYTILLHFTVNYQSFFQFTVNSQPLKIKRGTQICDNHGYLFLLLKVSSQLNVHYQKRPNLFTSPQSPDNIQKKRTNQDIIKLHILYQIQ